MVRRREFEGYFVFVVVALVVASHAHEHCQLVVGQVGGVLHQCVGVYEHLHALVLAEVEHRVFIDGFRFSRAEVVDDDVECLFVAFYELRLCGVGISADSRRQDIVDGLLVVVLLNVDGADRHVSGVGGIGELLLIDSPFSAHEVECGESQHDGVFKSCEEHTHEPDAREVVDGADALVISVERYAELVPCDVVVFPVSEFSCCFAAVNDEVVSQAELKQLAARLIDIHSQHENLLLGDDSFQLGIVDAIAFGKNNEPLLNYATLYERYIALRNDLSRLQEEARKARADADYLRFQRDQLAEAQLREGEEDELTEEAYRLNHAEDIQTNLQGAIQTLTAEGGVLGMLHSIHLSGASAELSERLQSVEIELNDKHFDLNDLDNSKFDINYLI